MNHHVFKSGNVLNFSDEYTVYVFVKVYKPPSKYSPIASWLLRCIIGGRNQIWTDGFRVLQTLALGHSAIRPYIMVPIVHRSIVLEFTIGL